MDKFMKKDKATADNRAYRASANASAQIQPNGWTSDTLGTLGEIIDETDIWGIGVR